MSDAIDAERTQPEQQRRLGCSIAILFLLTGILLVGGWAGMKGWHAYQAVTSLLSYQDQAMALLDTGYQSADPDELEELVLGVRADFVALKEESDFLLPFLPYLAALPEIGPLAAAAPALVEMADAGTEAAAYGLRGLKPILVAVQNEGRSEPLLPIVVDTAAAAQPDLAKMVQALDRVAAARSSIEDSSMLPWRLQRLLERGDELLPVSQDFARLALVLPELMGKNGPRRYLVLAQNQDELRPTGGFLSGVGYLEVDDGQIVSLEFIDANFVDAWADNTRLGGGLIKPYNLPPKPFQDYMLIELFLFRDANFWPDFAVSAQKALDFYAYGRDVPPLDGAIAVNQSSLQLLLRGTGPVTIADTGEVINSQLLVRSLQSAWTLQDGVAQRKAFLEPFAMAILQRLEGGLGSLDPLNLLLQLNQAFELNDLQVYMRDPQVASVLAANAWDGRLAPPDANDVLMIVDSNMGYNKANYLVDRLATYDVILSGDGDSLATLSVDHHHRGESSDEGCWQGAEEEYAAKSGYLALTDKCYWNYLRIYAPEGSQLIRGPEQLITGETWLGEGDLLLSTEAGSELPGYATFATLTLLPRGEDRTSTFQYTLPATVISAANGERTYRLQVYKQSGVKPYPLQISVTLPGGASLVKATPTPIAIEDSRVIFTLELNSDQAIDLTYR